MAKMSRCHLGFVLKHLFQARPESAGYSKRNFQRRRVLAVFDRDDGLSRHPDFFRQRLLCHLAMFKPKSANLIFDPPGHLVAPTIVINL